MSEKTLNTRIQHKHDIEANWKKATSFVPKEGEIIIYDKDASYSYQRIKIGDGTRTVTALPFVTTSVNGNVGDVRITASSIGAADANTVNELSNTIDRFGMLIMGQVFQTKDYNDLSNRPCYEDLTISSYNISKAPYVGLADFDGSMLPLRQLPDIPIETLAQVTSGIISTGNAIVGIEEMPINLSAEIAGDESLGLIMVTYPIQQLEIPCYIIKIYEDGVSDPFGISKQGTYFVDMPMLVALDMGVDLSLILNFPNEITIPGKQLDDALIPDNIARLDDIPNFEAPVQSVNGKTGTVVLSAGDVGADTAGAAADALNSANAHADEKVRMLDEGFTEVILQMYGEDASDELLSIRDIAEDATKAYTDAEIAEWVGDKTVASQISTAIADKVDKVSGKGLSTNDYTTAEKNKLAGIADGAEVNQNAFAKVTVGSTTIAADTESDTLTLVAGSNVTITPDATNDKITIVATDTVYTHPSHTAKSSGLYKVTVDNEGHVSAATAVAKADITALGIPAQDTTYSAASQSAAGLMSADDKKKLDGIATGANKITVDSALSTTSTNPVQNKIVNAAISNLNTLVGNTAVATQISTAISNLINGAPTTLDTLGEIATAMAANEDVVEALEAAIGTKANASDLTSHTGNKNNPHEVTLAQLGVTATAAELNKMDGVTATTTELNYVDGVTSNIQTQLNAKVPNTRKVNGKALSADITLSASDVGAMSATNPVGTGSFSMGRRANTTIGDYSHAEGYNVKATSNYSHAEGNNTAANGIASHAEGSNTIADGDYSHTEGFYTTASGKHSHAEGNRTLACGGCSHAEGCGDLYQLTLTGPANTTEYSYTSSLSSKIKIGDYIIYNKQCSKIVSITDTTITVDKTLYTETQTNSAIVSIYTSYASGEYSHVEGKDNIASGLYSHAEGYLTVAQKPYSHTEGLGTTANGEAQHVQGKYNISGNARYLHIVGNGTSSDRSNAHTLDLDGNAWFGGDVYVGSTSGTNKDNGSKKLATEDYVKEYANITAITNDEIDAICGT